MTIAVASYAVFEYSAKKVFKFCNILKHFGNELLSVAYKFCK